MVGRRLPIDNPTSPQLERSPPPGPPTPAQRVEGDPGALTARPARWVEPRELCEHEGQGSPHRLYRTGYLAELTKRGARDPALAPLFWKSAGSWRTEEA